MRTGRRGPEQEGAEGAPPDGERVCPGGGTLQAVRGYSLRPARQSHHLLWGRGRPDRLPGSLLPPPLPWGKEDKELQDYVASRLNHRKGSALLKYGYCEVTAEDPDTLRVVRYLNGTDGLGRKAGKQREEIVLTRKL